jgi:hypothetical protein
MDGGDEVSWININDRLPDKFNGIKRFKVKMIIGSMKRKEVERIILGRWYPSGFRFYEGDWEKIIAWKDFEGGE